MNRYLRIVKRLRKLMLLQNMRCQRVSAFTIKISTFWRSH